MDLHGIDLNLLVAFDALMNERSVTKAARRLGKTQPAVSAALARLRDLFNDELFVRGKEGLRPTPRAVELAAPIGRALREIRQTLRHTDEFDPSVSTLSFNVAMQEHAVFKIAPAFVERLRAHSPSITMHLITYGARDEAITLLDSGEADVAIGVPPRTAPGRIFVQTLFEEPFVCIMRKDHPAAGGPLDLGTYLSLEHLLVSPEGDRFGHTDTALARKGLSRRLGVTITQMYPAPALVATSDLIATLMLGVVDDARWKDLLEIRQPPVELAPCPYVMIWHRRNDKHPAQRWLRGCLESLVHAGT